MSEVTIEHPKYGSVILEPQEYIAISAIRTPDKEFFISMEEAEQITVITENARVQVCFKHLGPGDWGIYIVHHKSCSVGAIAKVKSINYIGKGRARDHFVFENSSPYQL